MEIDLSNVAPEDLAKVQTLLSKVVDHKTYSVRLQEALDRSYEWQRQAIAFTKTHKVIGITCGNQMGKSEVACAILACHLTGIYPDWWDGKRYTKPPRIMAAGVDSNHNKNVLQERLFGSNNWRMKEERGKGMIPRDAIIQESAVTARGDDLSSIKIRHASGGMSELLFRAYSMGREAAQGFPADCIMIDEQPNDDFWREALTRTKATRGHVICSFTPLKGATALIEELMQLPAAKDSPTDKFGDKYKSDGKWASVRASWYDAAHIPDEDVEEAKREYSYDYDARVYGMPVVGHGRIFPHPTGMITYNPSEVQIDDAWPHLIAIDIGTRDPTAVVQCAWDEKRDVIYITDCDMKQTDATRDITKMIAGMNHILPVAWPNDASKASLTASASVADQLREQGVNLLGRSFMNPRDAAGQRNNYKAPGLNHMNNRFFEGTLLISATCTDLIYQIEQYSYTETGKIQDGKDDCIDSARYAIMSIIQGFGEGINTRHIFEPDDDDTEFNFY